MYSLNLEMINPALLTIIIEVPVFYLCGYRKLSQLVVFTLANFISNTLLNDALPAYKPELGYWLQLAAGELLVVAFEYALMLHIISEIKTKLLCSICLSNTVSLILGILLFYVSY